MIEESIKKEHRYGNDESTHPSFGTIALSKITCGQRALFGSSILHDNMIALKIKQAHLSRDSYEDKISSVGEERIVEVYLSPLQFSEMLTTMNYSEGIPCTIHSRGGASIKYPIEAHKDKLQEFLDETGSVSKELRKFIKPHLEQVASNLDTGKSLGKVAQKQLLSDLQTVYMHLGANSEYFMERFGEFMNRTVTEAKATIDSHVDTVVRQTGLEALHNMKSDRLLLKGNENEM